MEEMFERMKEKSTSPFPEDDIEDAEFTHVDSEEEEGEDPKQPSA